MQKPGFFFLILAVLCLAACSDRSKALPVQPHLLPVSGYDARESRTGLLVITEDGGDANYLDNAGKLTGHSTDIVREIMRRTGADYPIKVYSWARGYALTLQSPRTVLFSTARTEPREKLFKWVGPLYRKQYTLYGLSRFHYPYRSLQDARKAARIGCTRQDVKEQLLLSAGFTNLVSTYGDDADTVNLSNLLHSRIDLWATSGTEVFLLCQKLGLRPGIFKPVVPIRTLYIFAAFSRDLPDSLVARWQAALDEIKRDGTYRRIMQRYPGTAGAATP